MDRGKNCIMMNFIKMELREFELDSGGSG